MQNVRVFSITAPGFAGVNTQDAVVDMDAKFSLDASNAIIDKYGRIGARKGWTPIHDANGTLGTNNIDAIGECVLNDGTTTTVCAGYNKLFKLSGTTLVELTYGGGGVAPTITASDWQMATFNGVLMLFQEGHDALLFDPVTSDTTYRRVSEHATYSGTLAQNNCGIAAYGRIWSARSTADKQTVQWSDTLTFQKWTGGTAGYLNLQGVWPQGSDEVVALAAHNNYLVIFGKRQILVYSGARDPLTMTLYDAIGNSGCAARDSVQALPTDMLYLSYNGVQSLGRTIQEKSAPINSVSRTVNDDLKAYLDNVASPMNIKSVFSPKDAFYLLTFRDSTVTYCFDTRSALPDNALRATIWYNIAPRCMFRTAANVLYFGKAGYIGKHYGYTDNGAHYRLAYYSTWIDFGDPIRQSILKKIKASIVGDPENTVTFKWGFDYIGQSHSASGSQITSVPSGEYNIGEYDIAEYSRNLSVQEIQTNAIGAGKVVQVGLECQVSGYPVSFQRIDVFTKDGAYK